MNEPERMNIEKERQQGKKRWQAPFLKEVDVSDSAGRQDCVPGSGGDPQGDVS